MPTQHDAISEVIERWRAGERPDADAVLRAHPELAGHKSLVLDLAYEEYCLRSAAGEAVSSSTFCDRFPNYQHSLQRLLCVHSYLAQHQSFASLAGTIAWPGPGDELLGFVIQEELGRGAMARVFLATQPALGNRLVALKLSAGRSSEAAILGKLKHPNIVPIFSVDVDPASGLTAICMEFLGSSTLCDVLDQAFALGETPSRAAAIRASIRDSRVAAPPRAALQERFWRSTPYVDWIVKIGVQLANALAFAHSKGVLHRDLKPSNVLITPTGSPLLLDFNLSFDPQLDDLRFGGTLPYAAPEQLRAIFGQQRNGAEPVEQRSDLFALGALLYQMLTGMPPFGDGAEANSSRAAAEAILARQAAGAEPLQQRLPAAGRAIASVIGRCLEFEPSKRPQSAAELAKQLAGCLSLRNRASRWSGRHRLSTICLGATLAVALLGGAWGLATRDPYPVREFNASVSSFNSRHFDDAILHLDNALAVNPADAKSLFARAQARQQQGDFLLASKDYDTAAARFISGHHSGVRCVLLGRGKSSWNGGGSWTTCHCRWFCNRRGLQQFGRQLTTNQSTRRGVAES